jgi:hypothetical protein
MFRNLEDIAEDTVQWQKRQQDKSQER